ncbi:MAG: tetratricopeptide repeat protein [Candidatus Pacebacteria bacterium]|nr:tetratricopeptide repeat protein [Candidatus Paceibacterota bacterium]
MTSVFKARFLPDQPSQFWHLNKVLLGLVLLIALVVYLPVINNGFVWDDEEQIVSNLAIRDLSNIPNLFAGGTFNAGGSSKLTGGYYKPLMPVFFSLNYAFFGLWPGGYHLTQLGLHLLVVSLVFLVSKSFWQRHYPQSASVIAFFVSLFFAIHPANSEAVVYSSGAQDVLNTLFGLIAVWLAIKISQQTQTDLLVQLKWLGLTATSCLLALLSKEAGVVFLAIIGFYFWLYQRQLARLWWAFASTVVLLYLFMRLIIAQMSIGVHGVAPMSQASWWQRLLTLPFELFSYLRLVFFPAQLFISQHQLVTQVSDPRCWAAGLVVLAVLLAWLLLLWHWQKKWLFFWSGWVVISLGLVLNLFPLDMTISERWLYGPIIGIFSLLAGLLHQLVLARPSWQRPGLVALIILTFLLAGRSFRRVFDWQDGLTLYAHDLQFNPQAYDLQHNYGVELFRAGAYDQAKIHFERSVYLAPDWWIPYNNLGVYYQHQGELDQAEKFYQRSIDKGNYYLAYENLAGLLIKTGELERASSLIKVARQKWPLSQQFWQMELYLLNSAKVE